MIIKTHRESRLLKRGLKQRGLINRLFISFLLASSASAAAAEEPDSIADVETLQEVVVQSRGTRKLRYNAGNTELITAAELTRAACCNLGESFTTNPSVDVSYTDAATGARQIRLLGLAGTYVQMLTENIPAFRGAASPFGLGYIPGPWMQSISVSKGASSVKNGYESISGQINVEMRKPQAEPSLAVNGYLDHRVKAEINAAGNMHFGKRWSGGLLIHGENSFRSHDDNGDGFMDMPKVRQLSLMNRWAYLSNNYVFQLAAKYLDESRESGQDRHGGHADMNTGQMPMYNIDINTRRGEIFTKNAFIFDKENDGNVALIISGSYHSQNSAYGAKFYDIDQGNVYSSLMFERKWNELHSLSAGLSLNYDHYRQHYLLDVAESALRSKEIEAVSGAYAQYTLNLDSRLIAMAGIRYDYSSRYSSMFTPRLHVRWNPNDDWSINASAGKGYRTPHPLAELNYLLASSRKIVLQNNLPQESAWNYGAGASWTPSFLNGRITLSAEYYFTNFNRQLCVNFDHDPHEVNIYAINGKSRSHTFQTELTARILPDLTFTGAYRLTDVRTDYGRGMELRPLTSRSKGLFTASWSPRMGLWQIDATLSVNGGGRMPQPYARTDGNLSWNPEFKTYCTLNAQITRNFRHWAVYIGGENLTGFTQKNPIIGADNPWGPDFDSTMIWGPLHGAIVYVGFRYSFTKY